MFKLIKIIINIKYILCININFVINAQVFLVLWEKALKNVLTYEGRCMLQKVTI